MTDPVNNPSHYNQNGIEVIDVIETYAKDDFRLANVLKYVCRSGYKGNKGQDLRKAQWYLERVLAEVDPKEDDAVNDSWLRGYNEGYADGEADYKTPAKYNEPETGSYKYREQEEADIEAWRGIEFPQGEPIVWPEQLSAYAFLESLRETAELLREEPPANPYANTIPCTPYEEDIVAECRDEDGRCSYTGKECKGEDCCPLPALDDRLEFHASLATRIAGDNEAASRIKDTYYQFDRFEIQGYCAWCDSEIALGQPYIKDPAYDPSVKFCKQTCVSKLKEWQGR